jgi:PEGA domain-containing protein
LRELGADPLLQLTPVEGQRRRLPRSASASSVLAIVAGVCAFGTSRLAHAEVPTCDGSDAAEARGELDEGKKHYRHALAQANVDTAEMTIALSSFDAACKAGDAMALEPRAYALSALQRYIDAAESLDAFLKAHPLESLPNDVRARVTSQRPAIMAKVATLRVVSDAPKAQVALDGKTVGAVPAEVRVLAGSPVDIEVTAAGFEPVNRTVTLEGDSVREESFPMHSSVAEGEPTPPSGPEQAPKYRTWLYASSAGAGVMLGAGIGASLWRLNRVSTFDQDCLGSTPVPGCSATHGQFVAAEATQIVAFSLAGVLAATAVVLWFVDHKSSSAPASGPPTSGLSFACAPGPGLVCAGTF